MALIDDIRRKQEVTKDIVPNEQIDRMRVLWKKGRNMFSSFFAETDTVKKQINNDTLFSQWCFFQLQIDVTTISNMAAILRQGDAARIRTEFAEAKRAEKERREVDAHARRMEAQDRKNALDAKKADNALVKAKRAEEAKRAKTIKIAASRKAARAARTAVGVTALEIAKTAWLANPTAKEKDIIAASKVGQGTVAKARAILVELGRLPKAEASSEGALYERYVEEGRAAVLSEGESRWIEGDLAISVSEMKNYGDLKRFATDIGIEYSTLQGRKNVAKSWPKTLPRGSFSLARELVTHPDRHAIFAANPDMTVEEAREIMRTYKATSNVVNLKG